MKHHRKGKYERIHKQLYELFLKTPFQLSRMATINALLYNKMDNFFWVGFYLIEEGKLIVGPYQGQLACTILPKDKGVCWAAINSKESIIVDDVNLFPGHIACDSRSKSEIVIPVKNKNFEIIGVLDIDSTKTSNFDIIDKEGLEKIISLLNK